MKLKIMIITIILSIGVYATDAPITSMVFKIKAKNFFKRNMVETHTCYDFPSCPYFGKKSKELLYIVRSYSKLSGR